MFRKLLILTSLLIAQRTVAQQLKVSPDVLKLLKVKVDTIPNKLKLNTEQSDNALKKLQQQSRLLIKEAQKQKLLSDNMICIIPDMEAFSNFPAVDPTKKWNYITEYIPNSIKVNERAPAKSQVK